MEWLLFLLTLLVVYFLIFMSCMAIIFGTLSAQISSLMRLVCCCFKRNRDRPERRNDIRHE